MMIYTLTFAIMTLVLQVNGTSKFQPNELVKVVNFEKSRMPSLNGQIVRFDCYEDVANKRCVIECNDDQGRPQRYKISEENLSKTSEFLTLLYNEIKLVIDVKPVPVIKLDVDEMPEEFFWNVEVNSTKYDGILRPGRHSTLEVCKNIGGFMKNYLSKSHVICDDVNVDNAGYHWVLFPKFPKWEDGKFDGRYGSVEINIEMNGVKHDDLRGHKPAMEYLAFRSNQEEEAQAFEREYRAVFALGPNYDLDDPEKRPHYTIEGVEGKMKELTSQIESLQLRQLGGTKTARRVKQIAMLAQQHANLKAMLAHSEIYAEYTKKVASLSEALPNDKLALQNIYKLALQKDIDELRSTYVALKNNIDTYLSIYQLRHMRQLNNELIIVARAAKEEQRHARSSSKVETGLPDLDEISLDDI